MKIENEDKLFERFPFLSPTNLREGLMSFGFECGDGWFTILYKLFTDIEEELEKIGSTLDFPFKVLQVNVLQSVALYFHLYQQTVCFYNCLGYPGS